MKAALLVILVLVGVVSCARKESDYLAEWKKFTSKYEKNYAHDEAYYRYTIFKQTVDYIDHFNKNLAKDRSFSVGINAFSDLTKEEFSKYYLGTKVDATKHVKTGQKFVPKIDLGAVPTTWNWTSQGAVTPIKNQGQCGSCWAFSTTGSTEGCHFLNTKSLVGLSEENLVECSQSEGNEGCEGGLMDDAFKYIIANKGIDTETSYPYTSGEGEAGACAFEAANCGSTITAYTDVTSESEPALLQACVGAPISVAIDAGEASFQSYTSGVYYEPECSSTQLDHGVLAVGWGTYQGEAYWLVKNSWGTDWGLNGYIMMSRNRNNNCGIATMASYPTGCGNCASN
jgi:cathepsin L